MVERVVEDQYILIYKYIKYKANGRKHLLVEY